MNFRRTQTLKQLLQFGLASWKERLWCSGAERVNPSHHPLRVIFYLLQLHRFTCEAKRVPGPDPNLKWDRNTCESRICKKVDGGPRRSTFKCFLLAPFSPEATLYKNQRRGKFWRENTGERFLWNSKVQRTFMCCSTQQQKLLKETSRPSGFLHVSLVQSTEKSINNHASTTACLLFWWSTFSKAKVRLDSSPRPEPSRICRNPSELQTVPLEI